MSENMCYFIFATHPGPPYAKDGFAISGRSESSETDRTAPRRNPLFKLQPRFTLAKPNKGRARYPAWAQPGIAPMCTPFERPGASNKNDAINANDTINESEARAPISSPEK